MVQPTANTIRASGIGLSIMRARHKRLRALGMFQGAPADKQQHECRDGGNDREEIKRRPAVGFNKPAGNRPDVHAPDGGERRQQRKLGGGERFIAQRHQ
jgi:hypothetical protein